MAEFKVGDTVRMKSGGPLMTITGVENKEGRQMVWCSWFDNTGKESKGYWPAAAVEADSGVS